MGDWAKIGDDKKFSGWTHYKDIVHNPGVQAKIASGDSVFEVKNRRVIFRRVVAKADLIDAYERTAAENGAFWLRDSGQGTNFEQWIKVKAFQYEVADVYNQLLLHELGMLSSLNIAPVTRKESEIDYFKLLSIIDKFQNTTSCNRKIFASVEEYGWGFWGTPAGAFISFYKGLFYQRLGRHEKAIFHFKEILKKYNSGFLRWSYTSGAPIGLDVSLRIASIQVSVFKDTMKAISLYHEAISVYSEEGVSCCGDDAEYIPAPKYVADRLFYLLEHNPKKLLHESKKVIATVKRPSTKLRAYMARIPSLVILKKYDRLVTEVLEALGKHPNVGVYIYKDSVNISFELAKQALSYLYRDAQIARFQKLATTLQENFKKSPLEVLAASELLDLLYKTEASIPAIIKAMEATLEKYPVLSDYTDRWNIKLWKNEYHLARARSTIKSRMENLTSLQAFEGVIIEPNVPLRRGMSEKFPIVAIVPKGSVVKTLYSENYSENLKSPGSQVLNYTKLIYGSKIGWVLTRTLKIKN